MSRYRSLQLAVSNPESHGLELGDAYILISFFPKLHEEEDGKADERRNREYASQNQIRFLVRAWLVHVVIKKIGSDAQGNQSHQQQ
jgi:hypothetical protein